MFQGGRQGAENMFPGDTTFLSGRRKTFEEYLRRLFGEM